MEEFLELSSLTCSQDLGSLLTFLQICRPLDNEEFFKRLLIRPIKDALPSGAELLKVGPLNLSYQLNAHLR